MKQKLKYLLLKLYPRILGKNLEYKLENKLCYLDTTKMDFKNRTRISPWALIRVKNEAITLSASLESIKSVITKGIIAYNNCTDGSEEIILEFCDKNPGFKPLKYPYNVKPAFARTSSLKYEETLAAFSNMALDLIPENEWFIKLDMDHVYFPEILEQSFYLPKAENDFVSYSRLGLIRTEDTIKVLKYRRPHDQILVFKKNIHFKNTVTKHPDGSLSYFETFDKKLRNAPYSPPCASLHFPYEKKYRKPPKQLLLEATSFEKFLLHNSCAKELPEFVTMEYIIKTIKKFNL